MDLQITSSQNSRSNKLLKHLKELAQQNFWAVTSKQVYIYGFAYRFWHEWIGDLQELHRYA